MESVEMQGDASPSYCSDERPCTPCFSDSGACDASPQVSGGGDVFADWLAREMPPGTIISNPRWWAPRIARAYERAHEPASQPVNPAPVSSKSTVEPAPTADGGAVEAFTAYFVKNYPGPDTLIYDPRWHAPRIFRAACDALGRSGQGHNADWCAGWNAHLVASAHPAPQADVARLVEFATAFRDWAATGKTPPGSFYNMAVDALRPFTAAQQEGE